MSETIISKRCPQCKRDLAISLFWKDCSKKDGRQVYCKTCLKQYRQSDRGKEVRRRHQQGDKRKASGRRHRQTAKGKATLCRAREKYDVKFPDKRVAQGAVSNAVKAGVLSPIASLLCLCGQAAEHYHHPNGYDEDQRLNVIPVCAVCHRNIHREIPELHPLDAPLSRAPGRLFAWRHV